MHLDDAAMNNLVRTVIIRTARESQVSHGTRLDIHSKAWSALAHVSRRCKVELTTKFIVAIRTS